jgi:signal transduction histidine kinase
MKMKFRHSLLAKYLLIIMMGLALWPLVTPITLILYNAPALSSKDDKPGNIYAHGDKIEKMWHQEAGKLNGASHESINKQLQQVAAKYTKANIFWVDHAGTTQLRIPHSLPIPDNWDPTQTVQFMKKSYNGDPFTTVAMIGKDAEQGFMVFQIPRSLMIDDGVYTNPWFLSGIFLSILGLFVFVSWLFFMKIRKRLVRLQTAMSLVDETGIPTLVVVKKRDEIAQLETSFNHMIDELTESRKREHEEEELRKQLIANLSHDLRTPLTTVRGHAYSLRKESVSAKGKESIDIIENKADYLAKLIENLLSYTLLSAGKYPMNIAKVDALRTVRTAAASWYPVFEKEGFEVDVCLPDSALYWDVDEMWLTRILDNLFQNIVRHAKSGKYVAIRTVQYQSHTAVRIEDKGPGMKAASGDQGARIGLTIIAMMVKEMKLEWEIASTERGTSVYLYTPKLNKT